jgi:16S rRNA (cytosine1402-N4)-methyltransferase
MARLANPQVPKRLPLRQSEMPRGELRLVGKPVRPAESEVRQNPRARSAIMRAAERLAA